MWQLFVETVNVQHHVLIIKYVFEGLQEYSSVRLQHTLYSGATALSTVKQHQHIKYTLIFFQLFHHAQKIEFQDFYQ